MKTSKPIARIGGREMTEVLIELDKGTDPYDMGLRPYRIVAERLSVGVWEPTSLSFRIPTGFNAAGARVTWRPQPTEVWQVFGKSCELLEQVRIPFLRKVDDAHPHHTPFLELG